MRILFVAPSYVGGLGAHAAAVAGKLRGCGFETELLRAPHVPVKNLKNPSFAVFGAAKALASRERYDVVHAYNPPSAPAMRCARAGKRALALHGVYSQQIGAMHSGAAGRLAGAAEALAARWADRITTDSEDVRRAYREKLGVDAEFLLSPQDADDLDRIPDAPEKRGQVAYVGRDSYEKGTDILRGIEGRVDGRVVYCTDVGWGEAMAVLKSSSVVAVPSRMDSIPATIKEALFLGVPVVAAAAGGIPEIIRHGETGILVEPNSPEQLLEAINGLLADRDRAAGLAERGREFAMKNLTWDVMLPKYARFYEDLAGS